MPGSVSGFRAAFLSAAGDRISDDDEIDPETGEVIVEKDELITRELARDIQNAGINVVHVNIEGKKAKVIGNGTVDIKAFVDPKIAEDLKIKVDVNYGVLQNILETSKNDKELRKAIEERIDELGPAVLCGETGHSGAGEAEGFYRHEIRKELHHHQ